MHTSLIAAVGEIHLRAERYAQRKGALRDFRHQAAHGAWSPGKVKGWAEILRTP